MLVVDCLILVWGEKRSRCFAWFYEQSFALQDLFQSHKRTLEKHTHITELAPAPHVEFPAIMATSSAGLQSKRGVPDPLSVRNTSLNPDALTRLHSAWKAKSLFQLGPACPAAIDFVTMEKSMSNQVANHWEKVSISFFLLLAPAEIKGYSGLCSVLLCSVILRVIGGVAEQEQDEVTNPEAAAF